MVEASVIEERIRAAFPDAEAVLVTDFTGTKDHYRATVVSARFAGMSRVEQHQAVYRSVRALLDGPLHALALRTYTPDAWEQLPEAER